jgi:DNA-binding transcriptional LysR family regulator
VRIRQFEARVGLQLFDRNTRSVEITRVGRELALKLERLQDEFDAVVAETRDIAQGRRGVVRLACLQSFASTVLPQAIARFQVSNPLISFSVKDVSGERTLDMVRGGEVDFGIADMPSVEPQLDFTVLFPARLHAILPIGHALAKVRQLTLPAIARHPLIMMDRETSARRLVDAAFAQAGCRPVCGCEVVALSSALAMVRFGHGVLVLPISRRDIGLHQDVVFKSIAGYEYTRWIGVVRRRGRSLAPAGETFIESLLTDWRDPERP